jgi:serine/threonine-protein phosphatase 2B catalytic subunit
MLLCALKINYPESFYLLRGNHECRQLTSYFNFRQECLKYVYNIGISKYNQDIYVLLTDMFDSLPIAAIINKKYFQYMVGSHLSLI